MMRMQMKQYSANAFAGAPPPPPPPAMAMGEAMEIYDMPMAQSTALVSLEDADDKKKNPEKVDRTNLL